MGSTLEVIIVRIAALICWSVTLELCVATDVAAGCVVTIRMDRIDEKRTLSSRLKQKNMLLGGRPHNNLSQHNVFPVVPRGYT